MTFSIFNSKKFKKILTSLLLIIFVGMIGGCSNAANESETVEQTPVLVMAAASLTEMFTEVENAYEGEHPDIDLQMSFAGSQAIATQIQEGVNADVFASANTKYMDLLVSENYVDETDVALFAKNKLAIIINSEVQDFTSYMDFLDGSNKIVIADETVPVGKYTLQFLENADGENSEFSKIFTNQVVSKETNVKIVASKVEIGEADAGIVYQTDLTDANKDAISIIDIPDDLNVIASYPIAKLSDSEHNEEAQAFVDYMLSDAGREILVKYGFSIDGLE